MGVYSGRVRLSSFDSRVSDFAWRFNHQSLRVSWRVYSGRVRHSSFDYRVSDFAREQYVRLRNFVGNCLP